MAEPGGRGPDAVERPAPSPDDGRVWGSDPVADLLRALGVDFLALVPGSSFRGLQDSLVNRLGNRAPQIVTCHPT